MSPRALDAGESRSSIGAPTAPSRPEAALVASQLGREPRTPWRVASRCSWGYPTAIASPARLSDGTPFPTFAWLTCPWLAQRAAAAESRGETAEWARRAAADEGLRSKLAETDRAVRAMRAAESGGEDHCATVGIAGQRDPLGVKCLHAHLALALVGIDDPIGIDVLAESDPACPDGRCARLAQDARTPGGSAIAKEGA